MKNKIDFGLMSLSDWDNYKEKQQNINNKLIRIAIVLFIIFVAINVIGLF